MHASIKNWLLAFEKKDKGRDCCSIIMINRKNIKPITEKAL
jgi:hypothetical protein